MEVLTKVCRVHEVNESGESCVSGHTEDIDLLCPLFQPDTTLADFALTDRFSGHEVTPAKFVDQVQPPILSETFK